MDFSGVTNTINRLTSAVERLTEVIIASTPFVQRQSDDTAPVNPVQMVESAPTSPSIHQLKISLHTEEDVESIRSREAQGSSPGKPEPTIAALKKVEPPFGTLLTAELGEKGKLVYLKFREPLDRDQAFHRAGDIRQALDLSLGCEVVPPTYTFRYKGVSHNDVKGYEGRLLDTKLRNLNPGVEIQSITYRLGMLLLNVVGWNSHNIVLEKGVVLLAPDAEGGKHLAVEKFDLKTLPIFCYRCWEPAPKHRKPTCTKALACGECGGDHDSYLAGECTAGFKKCINCFRRYEAGDTTIKYDHPAWADDCKHPDTVKMRRACRKHAKRDLEETTRQPRKTRGSTSEPVSTNTSGSTTAQGPLRSALAESENTSFRPGHNLIPPSERESAAASRKKQAKTRGKRTKSVAFNADGGSLPSQDSKSKLSNNAEGSGNTMKRRKPDQPDPSPAGPPADPQQSSLADFWPKRRS